VNEDLVDLDAAVLGNGEQHVEDLRRLDVLRRLQQQRLNQQAPGLEVALELGALDPDLIGPSEGVHSLVQ
jgi:hypothetical protein